MSLSAKALSSRHFSAEAKTPFRRAGPSILQGATDEHQTQFSIVHASSASFEFTVESNSGQVWEPDRVERHTLRGQNTVVSQVYFSGLYLNEIFNLVVLNKKTARVEDTREFKMLDTSASAITYAVCSCLHDDYHEPEIWRDLVKQEPDFILFAGDSTYCDSDSGPDFGVARFWRRFAEARATLEIYFSRRLIPIFATWDDHDFGENNAGRDFQYIKESQSNFMRFFAMEASHCTPLERGPGVSSCFRIGSHQFLLMDARSWRARGRSNERYAHWGREQEEWMLGQVERHLGMSWIVNGSQIFPRMIFKESMSGEHPTQHSAVCTKLKELKARVGFISGDVHYSEVSKIESDCIGHLTYELTSSSMHSSNLPGFPQLSPNRRRIAATGARNYLLIKSEARGDQFRVKVESRSASNKTNFRVLLEI